MTSDEIFELYKTFDFSLDSELCAMSEAVNEIKLFSGFDYFNFQW